MPDAAGAPVSTSTGASSARRKSSERHPLALCAGLAVARDEPCDVDRRRAGSDLAQRLEHPHRVGEGQLLVAGLAGEAVRLQQVDRRAVDEPAAVDRGHHPVVSVESADERDHPLGELLSGDPFLASGVELVGHGLPSRAAARVARSAASCVVRAPVGSVDHVSSGGMPRSYATVAWASPVRDGLRRGAALDAPAPRATGSAASGSSSTKPMSYSATRCGTPSNTAARASDAR